MGKYTIRVFPENCTGCQRCLLACSFLYTQKFNPALAHLIVLLSNDNCIISFNDGCNQCGVCADSCFYGALEKQVQEAAK